MLRILTSAPTWGIWEKKHWLPQWENSPRKENSAWRHRDSALGAHTVLPWQHSRALPCITTEVINGFFKQNSFSKILLAYILHPSKFTISQTLRPRALFVSLITKCNLPYNYTKNSLRSWLRANRIAAHPTKLTMVLSWNGSYPNT